MTLMNEYLSAMTDIIESHGGYGRQIYRRFHRRGFLAPLPMIVTTPPNAARAALELLRASGGAQPGIYSHSRGRPTGATYRNQFREMPSLVTSGLAGVSTIRP